MNKPLAIVKAAAAGVTALYHAVESAKHSIEGEGTESRQAAGEWRIAVGNMQLALDELQAKPAPEAEAESQVININMEGIDADVLAHTIDDLIKHEVKQP